METDITSQVWKYFEEICRIPRPSKKEEKICDYIRTFADLHGLPCKQDQIGNILITKPASPGLENKPTVILQSHVDMVCEKEINVSHDFDTDPIDFYVEDGWMKARGTTLGADDGIGVAATLAILADKKISHGPIEALFTVDEETGMTGALEMQEGFLSGSILINLDSETEGELLIGCSGGINTLATFRYQQKETPEDCIAYRIEISGMRGGHSGEDINKRRGNAVKILNHFLLDCSGMFGASIYKFEGGKQSNTIPREAFAEIFVDTNFCEKFEQYYIEEALLWKETLKSSSPNFSFTLERLDTPPSHIMDIVSQSCLLNSLSLCPSGVVAMCDNMPGMVSTSTNIASVKFIDDNQILITTSQRSDKEETKQSLNKRIRRIFAMMDAGVISSEVYPGWTPNLQSPILKLTQKAYSNLFNAEPTVKTTHSGLECGLFLEKYPNLDMISFGPTIKGIHTPSEKIHIPSVERFMGLLVRILSDIE